MKYFLQQIAETLYSSYREQLNEHCIVFPNRRAGLFFRKYLAGLIDKPVWAPATMTINDLFYSLSELQPAGNEVLLFELFKVYRKIRKNSESFDDFYFWGDMLLNDFDDADKYLVDASRLFSNVRDLRMIDEQFGGLTKEQAEIVKRFWTNADIGKLTREKSSFIGLWNILNDIYTEFRNVLKEKHMAYEGMIFREVAECLKETDTKGIKWSMLHFAGFNALNNCEKKLMKRLKEEGRAKFYWDYDNSYIIEEKNINSAGYFLRDNLKIFGNDMPASWSYDTLLSSGSKKPVRRIINTSSDIAQVKLLPELIRNLDGLTTENAHQTAVVLADENLLIPALTSLPEGVTDVNITMGFPLRQTSIYVLVNQILDLQLNARNENGVTRFRYREVTKILKNGIIVEINKGTCDEILNEISEKNILWIDSDRFSGSEILSAIFKKARDPLDLSNYLREILHIVLSIQKNTDETTRDYSLQSNIRNEFIYRIILTLNRLDEILKSPDISLTVATWVRILDRLLKNQTVPFSGEPLSGIQIMGILETRTLDFKNLIMFSVNEGVLPSITSSSSFIPFALREAFGLPSLNYQESIYAYHFYRLLHRAENVTFIYNSDSEGLRSGEMSRFLQQMKYDKNPDLEVLTTSFEIKNPASIGESIEHNQEHNKRLISYFAGNGNDKKFISPSAINTWLNCRMRFYYRYVNGLVEKDKVKEEIDPAIVGTILHAAIRKIYSEYIGRVLDVNEINRLSAGKDIISSLISDTVIEYFGEQNDSLIKGNELIIKNVLTIFINRIFQVDKAAAPVTILSFEELLTFPLSIKFNEADLTLYIGGIIDRIDNQNDVVRIIDYKTGEVSDSVRSVDALFNNDRNKNLDAWLQTLLYCESYLANKPDQKIRPSVYMLKKNQGSPDTDRLRIGKNLVVDDYHDLREEFLELLNITVNEIFSPDEPFTMTSDTWNKCRYCPYSTLCLR